MPKKKNPQSPKKHPLIIKLLLAIAGLVFFAVIASYPAYLIGEYSFNRYFNSWGNKLIDLEKRGLLSKKLGAAWQDVLKDDAMEKAAGRLLGADTLGKKDSALVVDGVFVNDYPSLSLIARLNTVQNYSNEIRIADRKDRDIARIRTNHTRAKISEFPPNLIKVLVAAEDAGFWKNSTGIAYSSIVRSAVGGVVKSMLSLRPKTPRGTSTITQQVAKLFISSVDETGRRYASKTIDRKLREMRLAAALRKMYKPEEILEVYVNHCITSDNGLIGCKDIARALFDKDLKDLSDAQCVYLARMVKWGRNVKIKIARQCAIDMPRMGLAAGWNAEQRKKILSQVQLLDFKRSKQVQTDFGALVDCANEYWLTVLRRNGVPEAQVEQMNIVDPNSLIRKKGNLFIRLAIDLPLQKELERLVNARGFGSDTVIQIKDKPVLVGGQYYAYSIMDSKEGRLLAYYSKDKIGSRLSGLLRNRTPNGSSTAKPILNALNFDIGTFAPYAKWTDSAEVLENVPWQRKVKMEKGKVTGMIFTQSAVKGRGYEVHNHGDVFDGCQYVYEHLNRSNNILGVETVYRLNRTLFSFDGGISKEAFPLVQYFYRIGAFDRIKDELHFTSVTGVRVYKELARIVGASVDSSTWGVKRAAISDSLYSVALGTLELTLCEQMHLFNVLYNNDLIERPASHPSLVLDNIVLNGDTVVMNDTIKRYHPFADVNNIRPTYLGMHKRLVTNDGLDAFDIYASADTAGLEQKDVFDKGTLSLEGPVSNIAKSGTTDDVLRPFDALTKKGKKTNYALWNAVLRVDLSKLAPGDTVSDIRDITVACLGEGSEKNTGVRDGKTLHKYLTKALMLRAGEKCPNGFFTRYEAYLKRSTPKDSMDCSATSAANLAEKSENPFVQFFSLFKKKPDTTNAVPKVESGGPVSKNQD
jgi:hypothetical protein